MTVTNCGSLAHTAHRCCQHHVTPPVAILQELPVAHEIKPKFLTRPQRCLLCPNTSSASDSDRAMCSLSQAKPSPASWPLHWLLPLPGMLFSYLSVLGIPSQSLGPSSFHHYITLNNRCHRLQPLCAHLFRVCIPKLQNTSVYRLQVAG